MHIQADRAFVPAGSPATRFLSVTLSAPAHTGTQPSAPASSRPGVDVSLVLDRSGSMEGRKIALARQAVAHAVRLLKSGDRLSVVAYDDQVDTLLELLAATPAAKKQALQALAQIDARGSTDLAAGWFTGARALGANSPAGVEPHAAELPFSGAAGAGSSAPPAAAPDRVRRVLLLTDGLANQGITDPATLAAAAAHFRREGIGTTTFGLGNDFDEELLSRLASDGGGHFYFIEHAQQIGDFFASELGEVLDVVARDVVFELAAGPGVRVAVLNPMRVEQDGDITRVRLGDLVSEQEVTLLIAVHIEPCAEGAHASVVCRVRDRHGAMVPQPLQVDWSAVPADQDRRQPVDREVVLAAARMLAEAARARALALNRKGSFADAAGVLREAARQIAELGGDDEAVRAVGDLLLREEDEFAQHMDARAMKSRHMASYAVAYSRQPEGRARKRL